MQDMPAVSGTPFKVSTLDSGCRNYGVRVILRQDAGTLMVSGISAAVFSNVSKPARCVASYEKGCCGPECDGRNHCDTAYARV